VALTGCTLSAPLQHPAAASQYTAGTEPAQTVGTEGAHGDAQRFDATAEAPPEWWSLYRSPPLDALVAQALQGSPQLSEASARLRQAQADLEAEVGTTRWPALNADFTASRQKIDPIAFGFATLPQPPPFPLYNAAVNASYTLDLFGANRNAVARQRSTRAYQHYELQSARLTLAANVVTAAIRRAATTAQIAPLEEARRAADRQLEIVTARYASGGVSQLEVQAQRSAVAQIEVALAPLRRQAEQLRHQLATYLGVTPERAPDDAIRFDELTLPTSLPLSLPSTLARHRPDIAAADAQLQEAAAAVNIATANLYPQFSITGSLGSERTRAGALGQGFNVWSIGGTLMQPLFRGGALRAQRRSAQAAYDAAAASYQQTVLSALQQVADSLRALEQDAEALRAREEVTEQARLGLAIARQRFQTGGISEFEYLEAQRQLAQATQLRIAAAADRLADTAALLQSLGGRSWGAGPTDLHGDGAEP
jgi:NodT family efflux transporter outer membrane factor (OMF) lipoprotein